MLDPRAPEKNQLGRFPPERAGRIFFSEAVWAMSDAATLANALNTLAGATVCHSTPGGKIIAIDRLPRKIPVELWPSTLLKRFRAWQAGGPLTKTHRAYLRRYRLLPDDMPTRSREEARKHRLEYCRQWRARQRATRRADAAP